jgi:hypothetical protein
MDAFEKAQKIIEIILRLLPAALIVFLIVIIIIKWKSICKSISGFIKKDSEGNYNVRNFIAISVTGLVLVATILIAGFMLIKNMDNKMDFIGKSLLPLWGTWVGAVIAFYFGKENFDVANKSVQQVIDKLTPDEKIAKIPVKDVMIPLKEIKFLFYEEYFDKKILDILKREEYDQFNRVAFLAKDNNALKYIIHKSILTLFITETLKNDENADLKTLTLQQLVEYNVPNSKIPNYIKWGAKFVSVNATLLEAKYKMESVDECQDVFVTENGKEKEPVIGLITNKEISQNSKL